MASFCWSTSIFKFPRAQNMFDSFSFSVYWRPACDLIPSPGLWCHENADFSQIYEHISVLDLSAGIQTYMSTVLLTLYMESASHFKLSMFTTAFLILFRVWKWGPSHLSKGRIHPPSCKGKKILRVILGSSIYLQPHIKYFINSVFKYPKSEHSVPCLLLPPESEPLASLI